MLEATHLVRGEDLACLVEPEGLWSQNLDLQANDPRSAFAEMLLCARFR